MAGLEADFSLKCDLNGLVVLHTELVLELRVAVVLPAELDDC